MKSITYFLSCVLLMASFVAAQETKFADASEPGCPLRLSGAVSVYRLPQVAYKTSGPGGGIESHLFAKYSLVGENISAKEILAYFVEIKGYGEAMHDHFFKPSGWGPGESDDIAEDSNLVAWEGILDHPEAKVIYVQFSDGSTWGDQSIATRITEQRIRSAEFYDRALAAYESQAEKGFRASLQKEADSGSNLTIASAHHLLRIGETSGIDASLDRIRMYVDSAKKHRAAGVN